MSVCNDFIQFDNSVDWNRIITLSRNAEILSPTSHIPIPAFDLGVETNAIYAAIIIQTTQSKSTWRYGGEVRQTWAFPTGAEVATALNLVQSMPTPLFLDKIQLVRLNQQTSQAFRLRYQPPSWFKDAIVIGWEYTGDVDNFVVDTLFDIGNKIGIGTLDEPDSVSNQLINIQATLTSINDRITQLENLIDESDLATDNTQFIIDELSTQLQVVQQQNDSRIIELSDNLAAVLSGEADPDILLEENLDEEL